MKVAGRNYIEKLPEIDCLLRSVRRWLLYLFMLTMPMVIYLGNTEYGYTKTIYTFVYISVLVLLWVVESAYKEASPVHLTKLSVPVFLLAVAGLLSMINAESKMVALQSLALLLYFYLIYLIVVNTISNRKQAQYLLLALIASGFGATLYGFLQFLGVARGPYGFAARPSSIISVMGNQNYLAGYISYLFFPASVLVILCRSKLLKVILTLSIGLLFFILFPIGARGAWLSIVFGLLIVLVGFAVTKSWRILIDHKLAIIMLLIVLVLAYLFVSTPGPLNSVLSYSATDRSGSMWGVFKPIVKPIAKQLITKGGARVEDWYIALEMLKDHPITGIGLGNYKISFLDYRVKFLETDRGQSYDGFIPRGAQAHNEYVQFLGELGVLGLGLIVLSVIYAIVFVVRRVYRSEDFQNRLLGISLVAGIVGFLVHSLVSFPAHLPASSLLFVTFSGLVGSKLFGDSDLSVNLRGFTKYVVLGLIVVLVLSVTVLAYRDWRANVLMGKGKEQMDYGNYRLAKESLLKSLKLDFQPRQTYFYLGVLERQLNDNQKALEYFEKCLGQFEPYKLFLHLATLYLNEGKHDKGLEYLQKFLAMGPKTELRVEALYFLARIDLTQRNLSQAQETIGKILSLDPEYQRALVLQGDIAKAQGNLAEAKKKWRKALEVIEDKLSKVNRQLTGTLERRKYEELKSKKKMLEKEKDSVQEQLNNV